MRVVGIGLRDAISILNGWLYQVGYDIDTEPIRMSGGKLSFEVGLSGKPHVVVNSSVFMMVRKIVFESGFDYSVIDRDELYAINEFSKGYGLSQKIRDVGFFAEFLEVDSLSLKYINHPDLSLGSNGLETLKLLVAEIGGYWVEELSPTEVLLRSRMYNNYLNTYQVCKLLHDYLAPYRWYRQSVIKSLNEASKKFRGFNVGEHGYFHDLVTDDVKDLVGLEALGKPLDYLGHDLVFEYALYFVGSYGLDVSRMVFDNARDLSQYILAQDELVELGLLGVDVPDIYGELLLSLHHWLSTLEAPQELYEAGHFKRVV